MAESIEGGIETSSMQAVLGMDDEGISTSDTYNVVVKDHGSKSGLKFDSVCITPAADITYDEVPEKTVQVLYTREKQQHGGLNYATIAVYETPREVDESVTVSKIVHLRSTKKSTADLESQEQDGVFSSDPETQSSILFGPTTDAKASSEQFGAVAFDSEAIKRTKVGPHPGVAGASNDEEPEGVFASDPEALKYIKFGPKPGATGASSNDEPEGVFASDPEALKYIKFGPMPGMTGASNDFESKGIFASDPEALKCIRLASKKDTTGVSSNEEPVGIFASDPDALECIGFGSGSKPLGRQEKVPHIDPKEIKLDTTSQSAALEEGDLLAEATGLELKDNRTYSVRVTGHDLPDGQQKKFVSVRSADGRGGPTQEEIDSLDVKVETSVGQDGMVEKFVVVE